MSVAIPFWDQSPPHAGDWGRHRFNLEPESQRTIASQQALILARRAYEANPSYGNRNRFMHLLSLEEGHVEMEERFGHADDLSFQELLLLAYSAMSHEEDAADRRVAAFSDRALAAATNRQMRGAALATRAKAEIRLGDRPKARATLATALADDPANKDACKRLAALDLDEGRFDELLGWTRRLVTDGVAHSRLFAAQALAQARLGKIGDARQTMGDDDFHVSGEPAPPTGWPDLATLNDAVTRELLTHPDMRFDRYGSASSQTWRVENPGRSDRPAINALTGAIMGEIEQRVAGLNLHEDPWAAARPDRAWLRTWAVITDGDGFENWHVHQFGWLSGVYYVRVPDQIANGNSRNGCIAFGLPDDLAGQAGAEAYGERLVRPREGLMMTFPSQAYHRTYPHETGGKRICFAFDVRPIA